MPSKADLLQNYPFYHTQYFSAEEKLSNWHPLTQNQPLVNAVRSLYKYFLYLVFGMIMMNLLEIWKLPFRMLPIGLGNGMVIALGILVFLHSSGLVPLAWDKKPFEHSDIKHVSHFSYLIDLKETSISDSSYWSYAIRLYEDNISLWPADATKSQIATQGRGSYFVKQGRLFFSTSDNSNPETNGRVYSISWPTLIRKRFQWGAYFLACVSIYIHQKYLKR
jgi:hypothetical protein